MNEEWEKYGLTAEEIAEIEDTLQSAADKIDSGDYEDRCRRINDDLAPRKKTPPIRK